MLKKSPLQFAIDFKAVQRYERSYFSGKLQSAKPPPKRPMIFQPFWTTSIHRVDLYRDELSTECFVGRYRGISTRTKLEVLPRNLCPLINERRLLLTNRDLKHRRRGRRRERQKTIVLISKTLTPHVHYTLWYISLPSSAKQRREMTKFKVLWRT